MGRSRRVAIAACASVALFALSAAMAQDGSSRTSREKIREQLEQPIVRGGIVFRSYCALCHGEKGDGAGRASKLYPNTNLAIKGGDPTFMEKVVRDGGKETGLSGYMPMWRDELSEEQIKDVVTYLAVINSAASRGEAVFKANCILCHGIKGDGKGRAAKLFNPPPADLTRSDKNDDYKRMIIKYGGAAMGRSEVMPTWDGQISDGAIADLVEYLRSLLVTKQDSSS